MALTLARALLMIISSNPTPKTWQIGITWNSTSRGRNKNIYILCVCDGEMVNEFGDFLLFMMAVKDITYQKVRFKLEQIESDRDTGIQHIEGLPIWCPRVYRVLNSSSIQLIIKYNAQILQCKEIIKVSLFVCFFFFFVFFFFLFWRRRRRRRGGFGWVRKIGLF